MGDLLISSDAGVECPPDAKLDRLQMRLWLHPLHMDKPIPRAWRAPGAKSLGISSLKFLAAKATRSDLSISSLNFGGQLAEHRDQKMMTADTCPNVVLDQHNLLLTSSGIGCDHVVKVPLLFTDIAWAPVERCASAENSGTSSPAVDASMTPRYIIALAPRLAGNSSINEDREIGRSTLDKVWFLFVGGCSDSQFDKLLAELSGCGTVRWDLDEHYRMPGHPLGIGGLAQVYLGQGRGRTTPAQVAVKCLNPHDQQNDESQVLKELGFLTRFREHPHINRILSTYCSELSKAEDADGTSGFQPQWAFAMELATGGDLQNFVDSRGSLPEQEAVEMMCGVMSAVAHLHFHRVMHRDVKAVNILLADQGRAILADLGSAADIDDPVAMKINIGTPGYAAPEILDARPYGVKADMFAAGVLLYFAVSGTTPFQGRCTQQTLRRTLRCNVKFPTHFFGQCSQAVHVLVKTLLSEKPQDRPASNLCFEACWTQLLHPAGQGWLCAARAALDCLQQVKTQVFQVSESGPEHQEWVATSDSSSLRRHPAFNPESCRELSDCHAFNPESCRLLRTLSPIEEGLELLTQAPSIIPEQAELLLENDPQAPKVLEEHQAQSALVDQGRVVPQPPQVPPTRSNPRRFYLVSACSRGAQTGLRLLQQVRRDRLVGG
mmetsp:Transcript_32422/g.58151  ORF Transcript_32422/g.58151 Transcript_32422/m.58151 type:complete len:663 (+) Transcript_32422:3-1991(+)